MFATMESEEHKSIHGLMQPMYVLTAGDGNKAVSLGVKGGMMGSARGPVSVVVTDSLFFLSSSIWLETCAKILSLKFPFVIGEVTKLNCKSLAAEIWCGFRCF